MRAKFLRCSFLQFSGSSVLSIRAFSFFKKINAVNKWEISLYYNYCS